MTRRKSVNLLFFCIVLVLLAGCVDSKPYLFSKPPSPYLASLPVNAGDDKFLFEAFEIYRDATCLESHLYSRARIISRNEARKLIKKLSENVVFREKMETFVRIAGLGGEALILASPLALPEGGCYNGNPAHFGLAYGIAAGGCAFATTAFLFDLRMDSELIEELAAYHQTLFDLILQNKLEVSPEIFGVRPEWLKFLEKRKVELPFIKVGAKAGKAVFVFEGKEVSREQAENIMPRVLDETAFARPFGPSKIGAYNYELYRDWVKSLAYY